MKTGREPPVSTWRGLFICCLGMDSVVHTYDHQLILLWFKGLRYLFPSSSDTATHTAWSSLSRCSRLEAKTCNLLLTSKSTLPHD